MTLDARTCPRCGGRMGPGFMLEFTAHNSHRVGEWVDGEPERGLFGMLKLKGHRRLPVKTYRCERCAYLESYAADA